MAFAHAEPKPGAGGEKEPAETDGALRAGHPPLRRHPEEGLFGGVCAGLALRFDVNAAVVRALTAASVGVAGIGVAFYALAWALIPVAPESRLAPRRAGARREAALALLGVIGLVMAARSLGAPVTGGVIWPVVLGVCGLALVWRPIVEDEAGTQSTGSAAPLRRWQRIGASRVILGALLVAFASASMLHHYQELHSLGRAIGAVAIIAAVGGFLVVPWFVRLGRSLSFERAARIREQERAEVAAHLHDSVLQTLALIQKRSGDPREVAGLARRQERELRSWLQERPPPGSGDSLASALEKAAAEVEERYRVPVEVVTVGDAQMEGRLEALVSAAREAMTNAAKFAGGQRIDLFAEAQGGRVETFVRDRGVGFDVDAVPADRRGVRDSIVGRMERHGGRAGVRSKPGEGTEVELVVEGVPAP
jgi:signal transduction histidine kinase